MSEPNSLAVVHLVRRGNDPKLLLRFLASLDMCEAGMAHDLVVILKGYAEPIGAEISSLLQRYVGAKCIILPDRGPDLCSYMKTVRQLDYGYFLFLNSFSRVRRSGWLQLLYGALRRHRAGLVGATGSWQSLFSAQPMAGIQPRYIGRPALWKDYADRLVPAGVHAWRKARSFWLGSRVPRFPNPHIRTTGFLIPRDVALRLDAPSIRTKTDAYLFESGSNGLTRQVQAAGLKALVVSSSGDSYEPDAWPDSNTFWRGGQEGLLISDNQTDRYDQADPQMRALLSALAWGRRADPIS